MSDNRQPPDDGASTNTTAVRARAAAIVLGAIVLAVAAGVYAVGTLKVDTNPEDLLSSDLPFRRTLTRLRAEFPESEQPLLVVIDAPSVERAELAAERLTDRLSAEADLFQSVYDPKGGAYFNHHALLYLKTDELEDLADQLAQAQPLLARLSDDPSLRGLSATLSEAFDKAADKENDTLARLLDRLGQTIHAQEEGRRDEISWRSVMSGRDDDDARRRLLVVRPKLDYERVMAAGDAMNAIRDAADTLELPASGVRVRITGKIALAHEELATVLRGMKIIGPLTVVLVGVVMFAAMRSATLVLASLATLALGLLWTLGFAALAVGRLNLISMAFGVLYIGLGADFVIHVSLRFEHARLRGMSRHKAIGEALDQTAGALCLCAVTTAVGFFSFLPTKFAGVSELGLIAGAGMFINLAASLIVLPALIRLIPARRRVSREPASSPLLMKTLALPMRHRRLVLALGAALGVAGLAAAPFATFNADPLSLRNQRSESVSTLNDLRSSHGSAHWSVSTIAPDEASAKQLVDRLLRLPGVDRCVTIDSFIPHDQKDKLAIIDEISLLVGPSLTAPGEGATPPTADERLVALRDLAAALHDVSQRHDADPTLAARAASLESTLEDWLKRVNRLGDADRDRALADLDSRWMWTFPLALNRLKESLGATPISLASLPEDLRSRWVSADGARRIQIFPASPLQNDADLRRYVASLQRITPDITGPPVAQVQWSSTVVSAFTEALLTALVGIMIVVWLYFRSVKRTLTVLAPLILGGLLTTLVMELTGQTFNFANVIALPLLLGVGVDNGIHMVHRAMLNTARSQSPVEMTTSRAILYSALTTIAGFGNLSISPHPGTASMGRVLTIGIVLVLLCTLIVLPALLNGKPKRAPAEP